MKNNKMLIIFKQLFWLTVIVFYVEEVCADYVNSTINAAKIISDDFKSFQQAGKRIGGRSGRLITFETKNNDLQVSLEFSVPFLSIPVKRSVDSMKSWASQTSSFVTHPVMNINSGAIALTGAVLLGGLATTFLWKSVMKDQLFFTNNIPNYYSRQKSDDLDDDNPLNQIINKIEKIFSKYDIDVATCVQKVICTTVRNSAENVARGNGTSADKIFDGLSSTWFLKRLTDGTAISDAILAGQRSADCEKKFFDCKLKSKNLQQIFDLLMRSINN